jgi:hypothetical protein
MRNKQYVHTVLLATVLALFAMTSLVGIAIAEEFHIRRQIISSGGTDAGSTNFKFSGVTGQIAIGDGNSTNYIMKQGFGQEYTSSLEYIPGDADGSGAIDIDDVVHLINYIFNGGLAPVPLESGDADCSGEIDIDDVVYLINYIFNGGPEPCADVGKTSNKTFIAKGELQLVDVSTDQGRILSIVINAVRDVQAIQLEFTHTEDAVDISVSSNVDGIQAYYGTVDGVLRVGLVDLLGQTMMSADQTEIAEISYNGETELDLLKSIVVAKDGGRINAVVTRIDANEILPVQFSLEQNYPNPFNPTTIIDFSLPEQSHVRLDVYNIMGQKVRTLVNDARAAGAHSVIWNGSNDNGENVASGVYFYRIESGQFSETRKMMLLK